MDSVARAYLVAKLHLNTRRLMQSHRVWYWRGHGWVR